MVKEIKVLRTECLSKDAHNEESTWLSRQLLTLRKPFETIKHKSLWIALAQFGFVPRYFSLLKRLCADKRATVLTDKVSDGFEMKRGTKQGVPLSSLLFNTILQDSLENDLTRWRGKGHGHQSGRSAG